MVSQLEKEVNRHTIPTKPIVDANAQDIWQDLGTEFITLKEDLESKAQRESRMLVKSADYEVWTATSIPEIDASLQLCLINYANRKPMPWVHPYNPYATVKSVGSRMIPDKYQSSALVLNAYHKGKENLVGTVRMIPDTSVGMPALEGEGGRVLREQLPGYFLIEPSRLCVLESHKSGGSSMAMSLLMAAMYSVGVEYESVFDDVSFVFEAEPGAGVKLYGKLGGKSTGLLQPHAIGEPLETMYWKLRETNPGLVKRWNSIITTDLPLPVESQRNLFIGGMRVA